MNIIKKTYKDQVIDHVYQLLLSNKLKPGDQLKESLLAAEMGVSRAPIREAMKELIVLGLVDYRPQIGNFIPCMSAKEIIDSYTTRGVLEGNVVASSIAHFNGDDYDVLDHLIERMEAYAVKRNHKKVVDVGAEFHDLLISKCDNVQLLVYTHRLSLKLHILFFKNWGHLYSAEEIGLRHRDIVSAMRSGDERTIEEVIREHYAETGNKIAALL